MATKSTVPVNPVVAAALDAQGKAFGLKLDKRTHTLVQDYLAACTSKLVAILCVLAGHCNKGNIDVNDVKHLHVLSKLFLSLEPTTHTWKRAQPQKGGAETTMASEYYGIYGNAYSPSAGDFHVMEASTPAMVRPMLPMSGGGAGETVFDGAFSTFTNIPMGGGFPQIGGGAALDVLQRPAFRAILGHPNVPSHPAFKEDAEDALKFIVECNLLNLLTRVKTERRKTVVKRGAAVTVSVMKAAMRSCPFVIPV